MDTTVELRPITSETAPETQPTPGAAHLDDYAAIVGQPELYELRELARRLEGRSARMVNSTSVGGGVAEMLNRVVPLLEEAGIPTRWEVMRGGNDFFAVTKAFHNALHGAPYENRPEWFELFLRVAEENKKSIDLGGDFMVIHDPQPVALIQARENAKNHWVWRCHIDLSHPNREVWEFIRPFVEQYDAGLFSSPAFTQSLGIPQFLFYPAMDPLADKNKDLEPEFVASVLERYGIDPKRPILTQISRFDRLKDPIGVLQAYRKVHKYFDCQLVLAGGGATDDPEGDAVLQEVRDAAETDPDVHLLNLPPWSHLEVNALQRASTIVIQKSLREGFGLTVTEALWKKKPVVASAVGGIPFQVIHKVTGLLAHSIDGTAYQIRLLLSNPDLARRLGENGHEHVKENFLVIQNVKRYVLLFLTLLRQSGE